MSRTKSILLNTLLFLIIAGCSTKNNLDTFLENRYRSFNLDWKFTIDSINSFENMDVDDSEWQTVDLPHDWSIEQQEEIIDQYDIGIFSKKSPGKESTGHVLGGTGWYRKSFFVDEADSGKIFNINFDGVYMLSDVFVNGNLMGSHYNGYTPFSYNITKHILPGEENIIAVKVRNIGKNSRWYSGSGIYRDVTLIVTEPVYFGENDVFVTTPEVTKEQAKINIAIVVQNESGKNKNVLVSTKIFNPSGELVQQKETDYELDDKANTLKDELFTLDAPKLWSTESPLLYTLKIAVISDSKKMDEYAVQFGIRSISFSAEEGFLLNGEPTLLKGGNVHHDNGLLGSKTFYGAEERRVKILKSNGFNAIRASHNPPSKNFLYACDRLGMLVMDEAFDAWERAKKPQDYSVHFKENWKRDLESVIYRDRNHPSIIMWSIGNEINERADTSGIRIAKQLTETILAIDTTRPLTAGICDFWDHPGRGWDEIHEAFRYLDIAGYNYKDEYYASDHEKYPKRVIAGTESFATSVYTNWEYVESLPYVIGDFVWTAMDYIGESGIGHINYDEDFLLKPWPWYNAWCGDIDLIGDKKPQSYYRDVVWGLSKLEMSVHYPLSERKRGKLSLWGYHDEYKNWTWPGHDGEKIPVTVYSSCEKVRIELNGKVIDEKPVTDTSQLKVAFEVPYEPGTLKAIGINGGNEAVEQVLQTTGEPKEMKLVAEKETIKANRDEIAFISVSLLDSAGNLIVNNDIKIKFSVSGVGELIASGNGSPNDMESFNNPQCKTFRGRALAIIRPFDEPGEIRLTVESEGLPTAEIAVTSE